MTVAQLMSNVVIAAKRQTKFDQKWDLSYLTLSPLEKVCGIREADGGLLIKKCIKLEI